MDLLELLSICGSAFIAVFTVLATIAIVMRIIILLFPQKISDDDSAVYAAVASAISRLYPNSQITKIEEIK
jgi:hypothetical protein